MSVLDKKQIMVIGKKETFLIRVLLKKIKEAGIDAIFCSDSIVRVTYGKADGSEAQSCVVTAVPGADGARAIPAHR